MSFNKDASLSLKCVWLIASVILKFGDAFLLAREMPCHYHDSIDITDGVHHSNKSILLDVLEYTHDQHYDMNYMLINGTEIVKVEQYIRGCICTIRPCNRLCCPHGSFVKMNTEKLEGHGSETVKNIRSRAIDETNQTSILNLNEYFVYLDGACNARSDADDLKVPKVIMGSSEC